LSLLYVPNRFYAGELKSVMPADAGIQVSFGWQIRLDWMPASAGMTSENDFPGDLALVSGGPFTRETGEGERQKESG
jgi:hypothetical protein